MQIDQKNIPAEVVKEAAIAVCEYALAGKRCPCRDSGIFACVNEYPGRMARAAIAAGLAKWPGAWHKNGAGTFQGAIPYPAFILPLTEQKDSSDD